MDWNSHRPPWECFPDHPDCTVLSATQGAEETWLSDHWWPFWLSLNLNERADYLKHWNATVEWRDGLEYHSELRMNFDDDAMAAEAAESEKHLAQWRAENSRKPWYDRFVFWR